MQTSFHQLVFPRPTILCLFIIEPNAHSKMKSTPNLYPSFLKFCTPEGGRGFSFVRWS